MRQTSSRLVLLHGEIKSPPLSMEARREIGYLLRRLQQGESLGLPQSRPMPRVGAGVHELRVRDKGHNWRLIYRVIGGDVVIAEIFDKDTETTPLHVIRVCQERFSAYESRNQRSREKKNPR